MVRGTTRIYPKIKPLIRNSNVYPEEGWSLQRPKRGEYDNGNAYNSPKNVNPFLKFKK